MTLLLAALVLSGPLEAWRQEIEQTGQQDVQVLRWEPGAPIPTEVRHRQILETFTGNADFQQQFRAAQALSITYQQPPRQLSFVLVNPAQTPAEEEPYVLAHEFGHLWLKAQRYPAPVYRGGPTGCLMIVSGDAVQHVLIRKEMTRRNIDWRGPWIRSLERALPALAGPPPPRPPDRCQTLVQALLWVDVTLGLTATEWPERDRFLGLLLSRFPAIRQPAAEVAALLADRNLEDKQGHREALGLVFARWKQLALSLPTD